MLVLRILWKYLCGILKLLAIFSLMAYEKIQKITLVFLLIRQCDVSLLNSNVIMMTSVGLNDCD